MDWLVEPLDDPTKSPLVPPVMSARRQSNMGRTRNQQGGKSRSGGSHKGNRSHSFAERRDELAEADGEDEARLLCSLVTVWLCAEERDAGAHCTSPASG